MPAKQSRSKYRWLWLIGPVWASWFAVRMWTKLQSPTEGWSYLVTAVLATVLAVVFMISTIANLRRGDKS